MKYPLQRPLVAVAIIVGLFAGAAWVYRVTKVLWHPTPIASSTRIPGTSLTVQLLGPDMKHHYWYEVISDEGIEARQFLGPIDEVIEPVLVEQQLDGQIRIQWGTSRHSGFCILDVDSHLIVRDANFANPPNVPFRSVLQSATTAMDAEGG